MTTRRPQRGRTTKVLVARHDADGQRRRPDELIIEEPLRIQLDGTLVSTTMRTPGNDYELAVGFLHAEGLLGGVPVTGVRYCADAPAVETEFNVVTVETGGRAPAPTPRLGSTSSSCGLCGSEAIEELTSRLSPFADTEHVDPLLLAEVADKVRDGQDLFAKTGAAHAAASFDADGAIQLIREDIGRHNAVDKIVGRMLLDDQLPTPGLGLYVSGRAIAGTTLIASPLGDAVRTQTQELLSTVVGDDAPDEGDEPDAEVAGEVESVVPQIVFDDSVFVDPQMVGLQPPWAFDGLLTFRGSPTRSFYGRGPVPDDPAVQWRFPPFAVGRVETRGAMPSR